MLGVQMGWLARLPLVRLTIDSRGGEKELATHTLRILNATSLPRTVCVTCEYCPRTHLQHNLQAARAIRAVRTSASAVFLPSWVYLEPRQITEVSLIAKFIMFVIKPIITCQ